MIALPWSRGDKPPSKPPKKRRTLRFVWRHLSGLTFFLLITTFVVLVIGPYMVVDVPSGRVGLVWKRFGGGTILDPKYLKNEGFNLIWPWDKIFIYDLRIQSTFASYDAITSDGINLTTTLNIRFRLRREGIPLLNQAIGPDYLSVLGPEVASRMREVISQYTAEQVYSTERLNIQEAIKNRVVEKLGERFMVAEGETPYRMPILHVLDVYNTLLHEIKLPATVVAAINRKAEQHYIAQEFVYRIDREKLESERKRLEAEGIRDFQQIINQGISDAYLRLRGIDATLEATLALAKSNNSKIVIVGGRDGLPLILDVDRPAAPPTGAGLQLGKTGSDAVARPAESGSDHSAALPGVGTPALAAPVPTRNSGFEDFIARLWNRQPTGPAPGPGGLPSETAKRAGADR